MCCVRIGTGLSGTLSLLLFCCVLDFIIPSSIFLLLFLLVSQCRPLLMYEELGTSTVQYTGFSAGIVSSIHTG